MLRCMVIGSLLVLVLGCAAGAWAVGRLAAAPFLAEGAQQVHVEEIAAGERVISYEMPPGGAWLSPVGRRLKNSGWVISDENYQWGTTESYVATIYVRDTRVWPLLVHERAELSGDNRFAQVRLRYRLAWRW